MNECELVKKILNHMNAEDYKILINKVWFRGFWVPGIANQRSDKKWRPKVEFINNDVVLNRKIRKGGKHNYELLIEAMIKMAEDRNDETYLLYNVVRWITDPDSHEEIEEYFNQLENKPKDDTKNDSEEIKDTSEKDDVNVQDNLLKKENEKLKAEIDNWKNRGKKYKENIQNLKIKCSNLEQENNRVKKENGRLIREKEGQELLKIDISDQAEKIVYDVDANPTLAFVPETIYKQIEDQILKAEVERTKKLEAKKKEPVTKQNQEKAESFTETVNDAQEELKEVNTKEYSDELLIQMMDYHSQKRNLFYNMKDFVNVHTSIKCSNLVILSGLSGTGKSALVEIYARALGIRNNLEDDRLLFVPVRPSWNDDADLLGYVDLVHNVYRPSDTGFVDFLVNAQKEENKGKLFIVCFDEMNLARVEHYFSQFLSLLERPENQRELQLYDSQYAGQLYNSATYPSKIIIGDNIRFIGTVNIDESTYHFSDKVLDRANVIELDVLDYSKEWTKKQYASLITPTWSKDEYDALINKDVDIKADKVQELLWEIHQLLQSASAKYGVGPRIVKAIKMYINNLPKTEINGFNKGVALDYQIAQRILTKVRGPEIQIGRLLNGKSNTGFNQIFDKHSELSDFKKCRKVISEKQKELGAYGYCI